MMPTFSINYLAILVCAIAAMPVGFLWFGPVFGRAWLRHMGFDGMQPPDSATMAKSMAIFFVGNLLVAFVLAHSIAAWRASSWGAGEDGAAWIYALNGAIWNWLGFFLPVQMGRVAWEKKRWGLVLINSSFDLARLLLFGFILAYWR